MSQDQPKDKSRAPDPQWVEDMHAHYRETGTYRPSDLQRVLGDPLQSVQIDAHTDLRLAAQIKR